MQHIMSASALHSSAGVAAVAVAPVEASAAEEALVTAPVPLGRVHNTPPPPWTPTHQLKKRNFLPRRMGHLIQVLEQEAAEKATSERNFPDFRPGDMLELKLVVPQNKGRPAIVKGLCIAKKNRGWRTSFTVLNYIQGGGPVERTFPLHSPTLQSLSVTGRRKVRRAKLYYLRDRKPNEYRV
ncbi:probable 50S ribosomal protein L19 [Coccomyxa sp. Obi]|nr:probable 50S ribosomal protein L19 [Coccomyxa sp. Obi]